MFTNHHPQPREKFELSTTGVSVPQPLDAPPPDNRPIWLRLLPLGVVVLMVAMIAIFVSVGGRSLLSMLMTIPMLLMMGMMYSSQMRGGGGAQDIAADIDEYDLQLRELRKEIHTQGHKMHTLRTLCYPNPADLLSLAGTEQMWQADPDTKVGSVVTAEDLAKEPDLRNLTANPYLRARIGVGVAPLYPRLIPAPDVVPEKLEPVTMVRYQQAMNILSVVPNLPLDINLAEYPAYAMRGEDAARLSLARAMLMSLAFNHRPSDLSLGVITDDPAVWEWMKWLPHVEDLSRIEPGLGPRLLTWTSVEEFGRWRDGLGGGERPHLLVVVDTPDRAVSWPAGHSGAADMTWLVVRYGSDLVSEDRSRIVIHDDGRVSTLTDYDAATADAVPVTVAETFARAMYRYRPRGYGEVGVGKDRKAEHVPDFFEALGIADIETHDLVKVWESNAYTNEIKFPVGYYRKGETILPELSYLNLYDENRDGDGPHGVVAGRSGSGKSFFLKAFVLGLVANYGPEKVSMILADFKGGATFLGMDELPHVVANISNLDNAAELVERLGAVLEGELDRREQFFADKNLSDIFEYREEQERHRGEPEWPPLPDLVVIIDEFGEFLTKHKEYMALLTRVGRVGRTLGFHLLLCNQALTTEQLGADLLNNTAFRFSLAVNDQTSNTLLKTDAAAKIITKKGGLPGKILRKLPSDAVPVELVAFNHEARYTRRGFAERRRSLGSSDSAEGAVVPFDLITDRNFTPAIDGEVVEVVEEKTGARMRDVLLEKVARLREMKVLELWKPSLREPVSLSTAATGIVREYKGLRIRIGDLDAPHKHTRLPWFMDFGGALPHQVIAGGAKSGRTTLLQTLVVSGCLQHGPDRLAFLLADYGAGKLGEVKGSPNVASYAPPGDVDTVERILGEARRLIALRRKEMVARQVSTVDDYLASKTAAPVRGDDYGYVIVAIDGIGGFLGEDANGENPRPSRAKLLRPILDNGAAVGVHLVYTADSMASNTSGNAPHHTVELAGGVQLPSIDYSGCKPNTLRLTASSHIPADQPGRSYDSATMLQARTLVPIVRTIEPDHYEKGMPVFPVTDFGAEIRGLCDQLAATPALPAVPPVQTAADRIDFGVIWPQFAPLVDPHRHPARTLLPVGVNIGTFELAALPNYSQNLLVYGQKRAGKTNALRVVMESVMRQFTPEQAAVIVIDPQRQLLGLRDRLYGSGFTPRGREGTVQSDGTVTGALPRGYVTSDEDVDAIVRFLASVMHKRRPSDDTPAEKIADRSYFSGKEIYVFVDNFFRLAEGMMSRSVFDNDVAGAESVTRLLATGDDLGVHFIVADDIGFADRVKSSPFLLALRDKQLAPVLQLSAPPSSGAPIAQAFHLKPESWRAGRGRLIADVEDYEPVQTAYLDDSEMTFGNPTRY